MKKQATKQESEFQKRYKTLNAAQKEAVDSIEGPVMVIAGPGTGKTHLLTMRICNILDKTDTPPEAILALTFTESAVSSMRRKLADIIGAAAYRVTISTFHGFANDIIKRYPDEFPHIIGANAISDVDQITLMRTLLDEGYFAALRPWGNPYYYVTSVLRSIGELKQQGVSPEQFAKMVAQQQQAFDNDEEKYHLKGAHKGKMKGAYADLQKSIQKNQELAKLYALYQENLRKSRRYDYSDMIMEVKDALERNETLLLTLQEKFLYILVDEHQDTNTAQNRIVELLASYHDNPNLFMVGDEKQAIFRFQGASLENFLYFKNRYPTVKEISLTENYRSTQSILDAAHSLKPASAQLASQKKHQEKPVLVKPFSHPGQEYVFLAKEIHGLLQTGENAGSIAVLYRENRDAAPIARILRKFGIPFAVESDQDVLDDEDIGKLLTILKCVQHFGQEPYLAGLLFMDLFDIPPLDIFRLSSGSYRKRGMFEMLKSAESMKLAGIERAKELHGLYAKLSAWKRAARGKDPVAALEQIVRESGLLPSIVSSTLAAEKLEKLGVLFDQLKTLVAGKRDYTLEDFFSYLDVLEEHHVQIKSRGLRYADNRVRLMTAHKSKGLEFDRVYIMNATAGHWGSRKSRETIKLPGSIYSLTGKGIETNLDADDDERNLFYVALTRAKKHATVSYATHNEEGRELLPSVFLAEIRPELLELATEETVNEALEDGEPPIEFKAEALGQPTIREKEFLNGLFLDNGISVTALNNYLTCPWQYFFNNLVRIPGAQNKYMLFGSAVHEALRSFFDAYKDGWEPGKEYLLKRFEESLGQFPIAELEYQEMLKKGQEDLGGYFDAHHKHWKTNIITEFTINGIPIGNGITINGKIDKLEILNDASQVNVVDYKTGKPKSRNELEGLTKNASGDYLRQLTFYGLLLQEYQDGKYKMQSGQIDFIQPDEKGNYHQESFEISKDAIEGLAKQVREVAREIMDLSFWNTICDNPDCEFCGLRKMMR